ncbi:Protein CBG07518 [Caenorhabditis briggsae]|uniref:Protein CBG07518 n=1 Tax=Caenorhabditis briggsae TaxID=6238 RepID=A8X4M8_CAEBR|nr:Protein CBG07518 [Caenorhabditis briggsae]CAP27588.1 Protein CBG07518 [Caenorhabditis briggsae]
MGEELQIARSLQLHKIRQFSLEMCKSHLTLVKFFVDLVCEQFGIRAAWKTKRYLDHPIPTQRDDVNCGIHVCLMAQSIVTNQFCHGEIDVQVLRRATKETLMDKCSSP